MRRLGERFHAGAQLLDASGVKARDTSRRSRSWSGGSRNNIVRVRGAPRTRRPRARREPVDFDSSTLTAGWRNTVATPAWPATIHAPRRDRYTGRVSRSRRYRAHGSARTSGLAASASSFASADGSRRSTAASGRRTVGRGARTLRSRTADFRCNEDSEYISVCESIGPSAAVSRGTPVPRLTRAESRVRTREQVIAAAAEVFTQKGFHGASLEEIAEAAGYSRGAVYSNFADKTDVFLAVLDERMHRRITQVGGLLVASLLARGLLRSAPQAQPPTASRRGTQVVHAEPRSLALRDAQSRRPSPPRRA